MAEIKEVLACDPNSRYPLQPKFVFFSNGVGKHKHKLHSFELALRDAGIEQFNLVSVSSIFPPGCKIISRKEGLKMLKPGQIVFVVMARIETDEPNRLMSASVGLAIPKDSARYGYLSEHHAYGQKGELAGDLAEDLAASMLASTLGIEIDPYKAYNERKDIYKISGQIVKTRNITQSAEGDKNGLWTSAIACAVFVGCP